MLVIVTVLVVCCLAIWLLSSPFYWRRRGVPYLLPVPLFGNNLSLIKMGMQDFYIKLYNEFPKERFFGFHSFTKPTLLLRDPNLIKDIFSKDFDHFTSNAFYTNEQFDPFGGNLLYLQGQAWREMRGKLSHLFTPLKLRTTVPKYVERTLQKAKRVIDECIKNNESVEMSQLALNMTMDVIIQAVLAVETDCFEEKSQFNDVGKKMLGPAATMRMLIGFYAPKLMDIFRLQIFDISVTGFLKTVLKDVMKFRTDNNIVQYDLLQTMMDTMQVKSEMAAGKSISDESKISEYNFKLALAQILVFISGGTESSAMTITFFLYEVALNQEIQDRCREEIMSVVKVTGADIGTEDVGKLKYMNTVMKETLRKYPPFPIMLRRCTKSYKIKESNVTIEPGTLLLTPLRSIQWDPSYFPEPEAFIPERFSDEKKDTKGTSGTYLAWGVGPRTCIGKNFAEMEMLLALARLLKNYRFTVSSKTNVPIKLSPFTIVTRPDPGLWLDVQSV